ncbi:Zn(2)-C6 fungal-type domain-containing protein [Mycena venus]|uniref:Zn(2)-C6 fungal-type domain-containing protein n=1 Tax=Mycena venus TaxID=2733690 RepID=A0A8H6YGV9_9AGAR|nr:Zn(2)-C6 fungal-type domain-containing protein [Mycena venus]
MRDTRLKIKCDKQNPCRSCVRRGCSALCPNGALETGQGTRFVLAATEHLHLKIARRGERIRMLEDALATLHASKGGADGAVHPLLVDGEDFSLGADDALPLPINGARRKSGSWELLEAAPDGTTPNSNPDVIDTFEPLSITDDDISRSVGPTGRGEAHRVLPPPLRPPPSQSQAPHDRCRPPSTHASAPDSPRRPTLHNASFTHRTPHSFHSPYGSSSLMSPSDPPTTLFSSSAFSLTPIGPSDVIHALVTSHLPPRVHAHTLVQSYFSQLAWLFRGVTRGQVGDMMRGVYAAYGPRHNGASPDGAVGNELDEEPGDGEDEDYTGPHDLALLFMIFAAGALVQPQTSLGNENEAHRQHVAAEAEHLHRIARAALALQPVLEKRSVVTIQALHLLSIYTSLASPVGRDAPHGQAGEEDAETSMVITLTAHLSQTIGLHRDSARWGMSATMVQRRRILFWGSSLDTGRPPSFSLAYIDCSFPKYENEKAKDGVFEVWLFRFAAECVADVTARTLTGEGPSYATILELDCKVREFSPAGARRRDAGRCWREPAALCTEAYSGDRFFAQAIIEQPVNPLKSTYALSFLAAYRASAAILKSVREQFADMPNACARFWMMWTFAFNAAVVFGTVVTRGPRSPFAAAAMAELEQACVLFSKAAMYSRRATQALPILTKLSEKARVALAAAQNDLSGGNNSGLQWKLTCVLGPGGLPVKVKEEPEDELFIFAGHTRFVSERIQRGQQSSLTFPAQQPPRQQQCLHGQMPEEMSYRSHEESSHRQSIPSSSSFHAMHEMGRPTPTVNVNMAWDLGDYPQSAHDCSSPLPVMDESAQRAHQQQHRFYTPDESRMPHSIPPFLSALYAWPVDSYGVEAEPQPQHSHSQQQQYAYSPQAAAAHQAHNVELAQLGLEMRASHFGKTWSTFMEDNGLFDGMLLEG